MYKTLASGVAGAALSLALVLACSDDAVSPVDAADCDCASFEPSLKDRIYRTFKTVETTMGAFQGEVQCEGGEGELLGGGCLQDNIEIQLLISSPSLNDSRSWRCRWNNTTGTTNTNDAMVFAICLRPPGS